MWRELYELIERLRQGAKLGISILILNLLLLVGVETAVVMLLRDYMNPLAAIIGLLWIAGTAILIWIYGGPIVDYSSWIATLIATLLDLKPGEKVFKSASRALVTFSLIQGLIVIFFLIVPIWNWFEGYLALLLLLIVLLCSGFLTRKKPNWEKVWKISYVFATFVLVIFLIGAILEYFGISVQTEQLKKYFQDSFEWSPLMILGFLLLFLGILKFPGRGICSFVGGVMVLLALLLGFFPEIGTAVKKMTAEAAPCPPAYKEVISIPLPPRKVVNVGNIETYPKEGEVFTFSSTGVFYLMTPSGRIEIRGERTMVCSKEGPIVLCGGDEFLTVKIIKR